MMSFNTINPATGEIIREYQEFSPELILKKIDASVSAYKKWKHTAFSYRSGLMLKAADILSSKKEEFGILMAEEMGKPILQGIAEAEKCAWCCRYYAENAESHLADLQVKTDFPDSFVSFQPLGVVLAIMPWNFPFWQVFRFAAPNLMAGNTGILKHSRNTTGCAIKIEEIFREAGFPEDVFTTLVIGSEPVRRIIENSSIAAVTLTGSTPAGQDVASAAGNSLKKCVMELGGSDPYIILEDANLEAVAETCVNARLINNGQSCIAAKRFIVVENVIDEFTSLFLEKMKLRKMGNPLDKTNHLGPQARKDLQLEHQSQVERSVEMGAELLLGGYLPDTPGFYYPPTIITNVKKGMPLYEEEAFGPVAAIMPADSEQDAINKANDTIFGLGAAIFTGDVEKGRRLAREEIQAGACFVNDFVRSDPRLPFGGIKQSGFGRELSIFGIREFVNIKTVCVK